MQHPIGIFDSGYGGLTILKEIERTLPDKSFIYLGDNARAPYGSRSFERIYEFTREAVFSLFEKGCPLVILACNTASAKALRTIQQKDLPRSADPTRRVLGIIRPTAEIVGSISQNNHVGILGTQGTISSHSYTLEIEKQDASLIVTEQACPLLVPLVESHELSSEGTVYFVRKYLDMLFDQDPLIDTIILGCTHYPMLLPLFEKYAPKGVRILPQGGFVADSLKEYLHRHPEMGSRLSNHLEGEQTRFLTTETAQRWTQMASFFLDRQVAAEQIELYPSDELKQIL